MLLNSTTELIKKLNMKYLFIAQFFSFFKSDTIFFKHLDSLTFIRNIFLEKFISEQFCRLLLRGQIIVINIVTPVHFEGVLVTFQFYIKFQFLHKIASLAAKASLVFCDFITKICVMDFFKVAILCALIKRYNFV